jgi:SAM-dependent methyltransferase
MAMPSFLDYCRQAGADLRVVQDADRSRERLAARWYASLRAGRPDYGIYDTDEYLAEAWYCWRVYASYYLRLIAKSWLPERLAPRVVVDLGCGIGWSTVLLARIFPGAAVYGTNRLASIQVEVARRMAKDLAARVEFVEDPAGIGHADLMFASEYFEHFPAPADHFRDLDAALSPTVLLAASSFTQPSPGHFDSYQIGGETLSGQAVIRRFNAELRASGYTRMPITFWNNRPACWQRDADAQG